MGKIEAANIGPVNDKWADRKRKAAQAIQGTFIGGYYFQLSVDAITEQRWLDLSWVPTKIEPLQHISNATLSYFAICAALLVGENIRYSVRDSWKKRARNLSLLGGAAAAAAVNVYVESGMDSSGVADKNDLAYGIAAIPLGLFAARELYINRPKTEPKK
jgi:hypothetical protein